MVEIRQSVEFDVELQCGDCGEKLEGDFTSSSAWGTGFVSVEPCSHCKNRAATEIEMLESEVDGLRALAESAQKTEP